VCVHLFSGGASDEQRIEQLVRTLDAEENKVTVNFRYLPQTCTV